MKILEVLLLVNNKVLGLLGLSCKAGKVMSGTDMVLDGIKRRKVKLVIVAEDAAERTLKNMQFACKEYIEVVKFGTIEQISKSIGKQNRAVIAITDKNLTEAILKVIHGGV